MAKKKGKAGFLFTVEKAETQPYEIVITLRRCYDPMGNFAKSFVGALHQSNGTAWLFFRKKEGDSE